MIVIGALIPLSGLAAWTDLGGVTQVYSHNGTHFIQTTISEAACGTEGKFYWQAADSDAGDMFAIVLAALTADKQIRVSGDFSTPTCLYGGAEISHLMISK